MQNLNIVYEKAKKVQKVECEPEDKACILFCSLFLTYNDNNAKLAIFLFFVIQKAIITNLTREYDQGVD